MIAGVPGQMALTLLTPPIRGVVPLYNRRKKILLMSTTYEWRGDPPYLDTLMWIMWHADVGPEATKLLLGVDLLTTCKATNKWMFIPSKLIVSKSPSPYLSRQGVLEFFLCSFCLIAVFGLVFLFWFSLVSASMPQKRKPSRTETTATKRTRTLDGIDPSNIVTSKRSTKKKIDVQSNAVATSEPPTPPTPQLPAPQALVDDEDFNIRSDRRTQLLTVLRDLTDGRGVSPGLWSCFHIGDVECVEQIVNNTKAFRGMVLWIFSINDKIQELPLLCKFGSFYKRVIKAL